MSHIHIVSDNGLILGQEKISGTLWDMGDDSLYNINVIDVPISNEGICRYAYLYDDRGIMRSRGPMVRNHHVTPGSTLRMLRGMLRITFEPTKLKELG